MVHILDVCHSFSSCCALHQRKQVQVSATVAAVSIGEWRQVATQKLYFPRMQNGAGFRHLGAPAQPHINHKSASRYPCAAALINCNWLNLEPIHSDNAGNWRKVFN